MFPHGSRPLVAVLIVCLTIGLGSLSAPVEVRAGTYLGSGEDLLFQLINQARAAHGLSRLRDSSSLHDVARWRSRSMIRHDWVGHKIPSLSCNYVNKKLDQLGISYRRWGEVIGWNYGYADLTSARKVFKAWMNSSIHRSIILDSRFTHMGIGGYRGKWRYGSKCGQYGNGRTYSGTHMYTVVFIQR